MYACVLFVDSFSSQIGIIMVNNKMFTNLLHIMPLTIMSHLTSPYYDNGYVNQQNCDVNSRQLKLTDGLHYQLLLATFTDDSDGFT